MITLKRKIGNLGEGLAKDYLKKKGYKIIDQNYFWQGGEIDLIALDQGDLVFVEVKTRTENSYGWPEQAVNFSKQKKIFKTAERYLQDYKGAVKNYRVDVISVEINKIKKKAEIRHFKNNLY